METVAASVIVFYSKDGNTKAGAVMLSEKIGAPCIELKEVKKGNFIQALFKKSTQLIGNPWTEIAKYQRIYLMFPIWASNGVPAMNAFLEKAELKGKEVVIITFQQFEDLRNSDKVHQYVSDLVINNEGKVIDKIALIGGKMNQFAGNDAILNEMAKVFERR